MIADFEKGKLQIKEVFPRGDSSVYFRSFFKQSGHCIVSAVFLRSYFFLAPHIHAIFVQSTMHCTIMNRGSAPRSFSNYRAATKTPSVASVSKVEMRGAKFRHDAQKMRLRLFAVHRRCRRNNIFKI